MAGEPAPVPPAGRTLYREEQPMRTPWLRVLILGIAALAWVLFGGQLFFESPVDHDPPPDWLAALLLLLMGIFLPWTVLALRLDIEVDDAELRWRYRPVLSRRVPLSEIESAEAVTYNPFLAFGQGIHWRPGRGWSYTIAGNRGVRIRLRSGREFLLGSRDPETLVARLRGA